MPRIEMANMKGGAKRGRSASAARSTKRAKVNSAVPMIPGAKSASAKRVPVIPGVPKSPAKGGLVGGRRTRRNKKTRKH